MRNIILLSLLTLLCLTTARAQDTTEPQDPESWQSIAPGIHLTWASRDEHYSQSAVPRTTQVSDTILTAWRGERTSALALLYSRDATHPLSLRLYADDNRAQPLSEDFAKASFVNYVLCDGKRYCGDNPMTSPAYLVPDIIDTDPAKALQPQSVRPVWLTIEVPRDAKPGLQRLRLDVVDSQSGQVAGSLQLRLNILDRTLPQPADYRFHTDFWQQPYALSRYLSLKPWSQAHYDAMKPYLRLLARSGQTTATAILFYEPWGVQSNDKFGAMIRTVKTKRGQWRYDYSVFDHWVELCDSMGINRQINCYSMIPWDMSFRYYDERQRKDVDLKCKTSDPSYRDLWIPFLRSFARHLKQKGWFAKTCIAMDERGLDDMLRARDVLREAVPDMKMALAGNPHAELATDLYDYSLGYPERFTPEQKATRDSLGYVSTTYTCCSALTPNLEAYNSPADAVYLPLYCLANGFGGYLHWSWMNWTDRPLQDSRFKFFPAGDTYVVYPGPRSSVRWERYIEGVEQAEKFRILRSEAQAKGDAKQLKALDDALQLFQSGELTYLNTSTELVNRMEALLNGGLTH